MEDPKLFSPEELEQQQPEEQQGPVTCLGIEFANDEERRAYFREELRKKLPELRKIEGFPIGEDDDIIALSDPPYYTACPNPWLNDFIAEWEKEKEQLVAEGKRDRDKVVTEPYAADVSEGKNNPIYMAHSYHTKVPHLAIMRYILHYTEPGDIVLDGFCGTGMTGVAANLCGNTTVVDSLKTNNKNYGCRHTLCSDLSPIASLIASSYNINCAKDLLKRKLLEVLNKVDKEYGWMYDVEYNGKKGKMNYTIWSDVFECPNCNNDSTFWSYAIDLDKEIIHDTFKCSKCGTQLTKKDLIKSWKTEYDPLLGETTLQRRKDPVLINFTLNNKRVEIPIRLSDIELLKKVDCIDIAPYQTSLLPDGEKTEAINHANNVKYLHQLYTKRNYIYLSEIYKRVKTNPIMTAWLTSIVQTASTMYSFRLNRKNGIMKGTLYIPSLMAECNPYFLLKSKIDGFIDSCYVPRGKGAISIASATNMNLLKADSVDYIFVDPPFGANLMYSELNSIWEGWIRIKTNNKDEAIINKVQNKSIHSYQLLINLSLQEFYRVLKPGKWLTMEFSNTSASVWNSIQNALQGVGFVIANVASIDKKQGSYNAITSTTAVKQDLVITCYKPSDSFAVQFEKSSGVENVWVFIEDYLEHLPIHLKQGNSTTSIVERSAKILYDRLISYYVEHGRPIPLDAAEFQSGLRSRYIERDGMFFTAQQAAEYEEKRKNTTDFVPMGLLIDGEANGIAWLRRELETPQTYQELQPKWMQALAKQKKGDMQIEMRTLLEENFIEEPDGKWRLPDPEEEADREKLRIKGLMREFAAYVELAAKPKSKLKQVRLEALREGFKQCWQQKAFETIVNVGDKIPEEMLQEDEVLLRYYDIASRRVL